MAEEQQEKRPTYPPAHNLEGRTLRRLLEGRRLSSAEFLDECGGSRLAAAIHVLRESGWPVESELEEGATRDPTGRKAKFARYWLEPETIAETGKRGRGFREAVRDYERTRRRMATDET